MIIGEAATDDLATEVIAKMHEHVRTLTGLIKHSILVEEGGRMVILITDWPDREQCLTYHASRAYIASSSAALSTCLSVITS
jgi:heme-degrading monooxygenase HmoA